MNMQAIKNVNDCIPLYLPHSLYLKPNAKFNISVSLPPTTTGKTISNWDIMEKLRQLIHPDTYTVLKVSKSTLEFLRFEAEIEERGRLKSVLARLDGSSIKLSGFSDSVKLRASEAKDDFPTRHDWDSFFRDARNMDELKAGERPDTIHISNLPIRWFCARHLENTDNVKPSESIFKRIFEKFGPVRMVDIPICDPYRSQMKSHMSGMKTFSFDQELYFEGYVQFEEYGGFVKLMDELRGMKLVKRLGDANLAVNITVNFDKTKHLSESTIKRRNVVRERFIAKDRIKEEEEKRKQEDELMKKERERKQQEELKLAEEERQLEREEKRKEKYMKKIREKEQQEIASKIRSEEKKLLIAQRKLESFRLLEALFERIKTKTSKMTSVKVENEKDRRIKGNGQSGKNTSDKIGGLEGKDLRNKLMRKYKINQEKELQMQRERVRQVKEGKEILTTILGGDKSRSPSVNSISSNDSVLSNQSKKSVKRKKKKRNSSTSSSASESHEKSSRKNNEHQMRPGVPMQSPFVQMPNPEMCEMMNMFPYPSLFFQPHMQHHLQAFNNCNDLYVNPMAFRGYRMRPRGRGRGRGMRSRGGYAQSGNPYDTEQYYRYFQKTSGTADDADYDNRDRTRSYSRSRHSRSRSKRSYSRSRSRSRSRSKSRSNSRSKSKKLVSTLRRSHSRTSSSTNWTRSRSRSRSKTWSRDGKSRSKSRSKSNTKSRSKSKSESSHSKSRSKSYSRSRSRSRSRSDSRSSSKSRSDEKLKSKHTKITLKAEKNVKSAKETQKHVHKRMTSEDQRNRSDDSDSERPRKSTNASKRRSSSVDSSKFISPKRQTKSTTPENHWSK